MDKTIAKENLFAIVDILERLDLRYFLIFGTLLGVVREKDFINHDTDTDIGVFMEFSERFGEVRALAEDRGFTVLRGGPGERLFSFMRNDEYLDCYCAERKKVFPGRTMWDIDGSWIPGRHLDNLDRIEFLGRSFCEPSDSERVLIILYGRGWKTPVIRSPAKPSFSNRIKRFLKQKDKMNALERHFRIRRNSGGLKVSK